MATTNITTAIDNPNPVAAPKFATINGHSADDPGFSKVADRIRTGTANDSDLDLAAGWPFHVEGVTNHESVNTRRSQSKAADDHMNLHENACELRNAGKRCGAHPLLKLYSPLQISGMTSPKPDWIIEGFLAREAITELDGKIKASGKTTFALEAVRAIVAGEPFLGYTTSRTRIIYVTEQQQGPFLTALVRAKLDSYADTDIRVLFRSDFPQTLSWAQLVAYLVEECRDFGADLLVIDTIAKLAGIREENSPSDWNDAMTPLQDAAASKLAIWLLRHSRKGSGDVGDTGRGSSAASGDVDIILELKRPEGNVPGTRRILESLGRYDETPEKLVINRTDNGYENLGTDMAVAKAEATRFVSATISGEFGRNESEGSRGVTEDQLVTAGSQADPKFSRTSIQNAIKELLAVNKIYRAGGGVKGNPWRYLPFLAEPEEAA